MAKAMYNKIRLQFQSMYKHVQCKWLLRLGDNPSRCLLQWRDCHAALPTTRAWSQAATVERNRRQNQWHRTSRWHTCIAMTDLITQHTPYTFSGFWNVGHNGRLRRLKSNLLRHFWCDRIPHNNNYSDKSPCLNCQLLPQSHTKTQ